VALASAGVDGVQLREKSLDDLGLLELASSARAALPAGVRLIVNGRLDVALAAGADGVQLPADGLPVRAVRAAAGPGLLVGRTTHDESEVAALAAEGAADYALFGPVFATPGKTDARPPLGLDRLAAACAFGLPVVAVGGVDAVKAARALEAGAAGVAAIRACADAPGARARARAARAASGRRA
jgi:thiamine-phosphate pyrophosphorylase